MQYDFLLFLAVILISTKVLGLFSEKVHMPQVVGALVAGILLGPSVFNLISLEGSDAGTFLTFMSEVGVILLMFSAGLGTDLNELKENAVAALIVAGIGVIVPVVGGAASYWLLFHNAPSYIFLKAVFVGVVLSATSVSITVETLRELGKLQGRVGTTILGAAVIDDILGIIVLTIVTSLSSGAEGGDADAPWLAKILPGNGGIVTVLLEIVLFFVFIAVVAVAMTVMYRHVKFFGKQRRTAIMAVAFCFILSYLSETLFGIADITGAYFAGLILCTMRIHKYITRRVEIASYLIFSPVFFACIGLKVALQGMNGTILIFSVLLLVVAILSKVIGCGLGAKLCKFTGKESLQIGVGMISRGEVALIVAQKGEQYHLLGDELFAPVVLVVIVTTLITPLLLKVVMADKNKEAAKA